MKKVLYYLNQFFGQIGGEDQADIEPRLVEGAIGPAMAFSQQLEDGEVTHTIICGDNYFNENLELAQQFVMESYNELQPDLVVAGPAFNAGRYGMACAGVVNTLKDKTTVLTGMYHENPAVDQCRSHAYIVPTGDSAASMRKALPAMVELATKILAGKEISAEEDGFMMQGRRLTVFSNQTGAERASEMLLKRLRNESYETELPMPEFDYVQAASPITDMAHATIALVTTGGIVPEGNPDHLQSASAQKWVKYDVSNLTQLAGEFITVHGGFDPVYANDKADRVAPLDELHRLKEKGIIGDIYKYFYSTTGTGTSVGNSEKFGREIGQELSDAKVDGVILTST
ncbi:sarcosine reductase [Aerococcus sp. HMSC072A12]|nr:sarcosine reductase [Aerococcus sp. HMSC072A12]OFT37271.1 sarcosine reductase [Aerococcus sp. HMSC06H08]